MYPSPSLTIVQFTSVQPNPRAIIMNDMIIIYRLVFFFFIALYSKQQIYHPTPVQSTTITHLFSFCPINFPETGSVLGQRGRRNWTSRNGGLLAWAHGMLLVHTVDSGDRLTRCRRSRSCRQRRRETVRSWRRETGFCCRQRGWSSAGRSRRTVTVVVRGTTHNFSYPRGNLNFSDTRPQTLSHKFLSFHHE